MEICLVKTHKYRRPTFSVRWMVVGAFVLCGLGASGCGSESACTRCPNGSYPSDPAQHCSPCKACPERVTDASSSNILIWCHNGTSQPDAAQGEAHGEDGSALDGAGE